MHVPANMSKDRALPAVFSLEMYCTKYALASFGLQRSTHFGPSLGRRLWMTRLGMNTEETWSGSTGTGNIVLKLLLRLRYMSRDKVHLLRMQLRTVRIRSSVFSS
jgi:hypothetical protein